MPASVQTILGTMCRDKPGAYNDTSVWMYSRGIGKCEQIDAGDEPNIRMANQIVFVFQVMLHTNSAIVNIYWVEHF